MRGCRSNIGKAQRIFWLKTYWNISKSGNSLQRRLWQLIRPRNRFAHAISGLDGKHQTFIVFFQPELFRPVAKVLQGDGIEIAAEQIARLLPDHAGHTLVDIVADRAVLLHGGAGDRLDRPFQHPDDLAHGDFLGRVSERVPSFRSAGTVDYPGFFEHKEDLLQETPGNPLPLGNFIDLNHFAVGIVGDIE